jgi:hypothetical protein
LKAIVDKPKAVNQIPITGQAAKKKCNERELLNEAYWKIKRPKSDCQKVSLMSGLYHLPFKLKTVYKLGLKRQVFFRESGAKSGN